MKKIWTGLVIMTLSWAPAMAALAGGTHAENGFDGYHGMYGMGMGGFILGPIIMILILAAVIALIVMLLRWLNVIPRGSSRRGAQDILEERFARGEIDREEFEDRRRTLGD